MLYVQSPDAATDAALVEAGQAVIDEVARVAALEPDEYDVEVLISDYVETAIREAIEGYETVCIGLSHRTDSSRILYGTITENIALNASGNVMLIRGQ